MLFRTLTIAALALLHLSPAYRQSAHALADASRPFTLEEVWTSNATYSDRQHGVTWHYPSSWKAGIQFAYHPPALTQSDRAKPIAGFGYSEGGFPRAAIVGPYSKTNLEAFGVVYSALAAVNANACEAIARSLSIDPNRRTVIFRGRAFSEHDTGQIGMSQSSSGKLYATDVGHTCYLFETDVAVATSGALTDSRALTPRESRFIGTHLLHIMESVRIAPPKSGRD